MIPYLKGYYFMKKNNVIQAFSVACCGVLVLGFCLNNSESLLSVSAESTKTAGITNVISVNVEKDSEAYATLLATASDVTATGSSESTGVYGYNNIGIAQVDGNLNVRAEASESGEIVGKLPNNGACEVISVANGWAQITSGEVEGYVSTDYLVTGEEAVSLAHELAAWVATVTGDGLRIRQEASTDAPIIINLSSGEKLEVEEDMGDWIKVSVDGEEGYVSADYVTVAEELEDAMTLEEITYGEGVSDVRVSLVNYALQFVGNPYVWGGTSLTHGCDCSGFVMSIYANYGIYLPHSSRAQAGYGTKISASEAQPGDLFFYGSGGISHVAIYIGNGQIVHASNKRTGIKISSAYYRNPVKVVSLLG
ncbi:MAG: SH3 domain-containing protein [Lachnospiraceae bacterium]|nr:SH3 domain-containing protein [Lachnospiraceae bacterium]